MDLLLTRHKQAPVVICTPRLCPCAWAVGGVVGHSFELVPFTPLGASNKLTIVQCSGCGAAIGVLDPTTGFQIDALKDHVAAIDERLNRIAKALQD